MMERGNPYNKHACHDILPTGWRQRVYKNAPIGSDWHAQTNGSRHYKDEKSSFIFTEKKFMHLVCEEPINLKSNSI